MNHSIVFISFTYLLHLFYYVSLNVLNDHNILLFLMCGSCYTLFWCYCLVTTSCYILDPDMWLGHFFSPAHQALCNLLQAVEESKEDLGGTEI